MTAILQQPHPPRVKKWTAEEYLELVERGAFRDQRVYLFRGDIIEMAPQNHPHQYAIMKLNRYLTSAFPEPYEVRIQFPFRASGESVPEPDAAVCTADDAVMKPTPSHAELIVEVAYSSLTADRELAREYAAARVAEYWIVDVDNRCIEVYRNPIEDSAGGFGYRYEKMEVFKIGHELSPIGRGKTPLTVSILFA
jgi:Uma2 family endonuclease